MSVLQSESGVLNIRALGRRLGIIGIVAYYYLYGSICVFKQNLSLRTHYTPIQPFAMYSARVIASTSRPWHSLPSSLSTSALAPLTLPYRSPTEPHGLPSPCSMLYHVAMCLLNSNIQTSKGHAPKRRGLSGLPLWKQCAEVVMVRERSRLGDSPCNRGRF